MPNVSFLLVTGFFCDKGGPRKQSFSALPPSTKVEEMKAEFVLLFSPNDGNCRYCDRR